MFKYFIYKFGQFCVTHLPLSLSYRWAIFLSDMHYKLSFRDRKAVHANLRAFVPIGSNIPYLAREVFRNFGKYLVEFFRMARFLNQEFVDKNVKIENFEYVTEVLSKNKGGIILTAHIGNWELGGAVVSVLGYPPIAIALPHKERPVNDLFNSQREATGVSVIASNVAVRRCVERLKENRLVALLADRDFSSSGEVMDFLGRKACIPRGPAVFSLKTGAPLIPVFFVREEDDTFTLMFDKPIYPPESGDERENILSIMKQCTVLIERKIREYPTQWLMFREFWV